MRLLRVLLIVTAIAGCGGGDSTPPAFPPRGVLTLWAGTSIYGSCCTPSDTASRAFIGTQGSAPASMGAPLTWSPEVYVTTSQTGTMFGHTFVDSASWGYPGSGSVTIYPAIAMDAGTFTGTVTINGCAKAFPGPCKHVANSPKTVYVTYTVHGLSLTPAQLTFSSSGTNPGIQTATLAVTGEAAAYTWQVTYSPSVTEWLQVRPASGAPDLSSGAQTVEFGVNAAGLPAGVHSAKVTFSASPRFNQSMTVTLLVGDPSVNFVAPYVVPAAAAGNVIIRGRGFSTLGASDPSVRFNSTPATSATVVSDTEIRATYPPLAAGSYSISVGSSTATIPSRAALKLVVMDPPAFPLRTIARPANAGAPANLIYDAERRALLFTDPANNRILRYALSGSGDASVDNLGWMGRIALSPDGTELLRGAPQDFLRLDPVTLAVKSSVNTSASLSGSNVYGLGFANDGGAIASGFGRDGALLWRYDMLTRTLTPLSFMRPTATRQVFASADGRTLMLPYVNNTNVADTRLHTYDASTGALTPRQPTTDGFRALRMSRDGSRIVLADAPWTTGSLDAPPVLSGQTTTQTTVYDADFNVLGTLPDGPTTFVLSPDGNLAYAYYAVDGRVRKFSVGASVVEVGSGSVVAPANTEMSEMTISPDGGTLFLAGRTSVVIAPAP